LDSLQKYGFKFVETIDVSACIREYVRKKKDDLGLFGEKAYKSEE